MVVQRDGASERGKFATRRGSHDSHPRRIARASMVMKIQGAIIAAGRGERLRGASEIPKPLVELGGETMLARQARALIAAGAESVVAIVNSETARIAEQMKIAMPPALKIVVRD